MKYLTIVITVIFFLSNFFDTDAQIVNRFNKVSNELAYSSNIPGFTVFKNSNIQVENIFRDQKDKFGLDKESDMKLLRTDFDNIGVAHYRFVQTYKNIPVEGAQYIFHQKPGRKLISNGYYATGLDLDVKPSISENFVINSALNEVAAKSYMWESAEAEKLLKLITKDKNATYYPKPVLVIVGPLINPEIKDYKLAYKTMIFSSEPYEIQVIYTDAKTGEIIFKYNNMQFKNELGKALTMYADTVDLTTDHFERGFRLRENREGINITTLDANNRFDNLNTTDFTDTDNFWNNVNSRIDQTATDVHWGTEMTYDYYKKVHGRNSIDNKGMDMLSLVHVGQNWYNASWNGAYMSYGDGYGAPLTQLAVVSHELTHGVTQYTAGLIYAYESGALNESFSDIFGVSAMYWAGVTNEDGSMIWQIVGRNLADPNATGQPDTYLGSKWYSGGGDNGGVHTNSQVQNHWYYLLVEGGTGVNDNDREYTVNGIGVKKAEKIAYRTLVYYLTPGAQYFDSRNASLQAAEDLFGMCSNEYKQVAKAWFAIGVGTPVTPTDVGLTDLLLPETSCELLSEDEHIKVEIKYFGACKTLAKGTVIPIEFSVNSGDTLTEDFTLPADLDGGDKIDYTTNASFDMSEQGLYNIYIKTMAPEDSNITNDELYYSIYSGYQHGDKYDISLEDIVSPATSCNKLSDAEKVTLKILNNGCEDIPTQTSILIKFKTQGNDLEETLVLDKTFESKSELTYTFDKTADLSEETLYEMEAEVILDSDPSTDNNNLSKLIVSGSIDAMNYNEDFEENTGGWTSQALNNQNDWQWGMPAQKYINKASSGEKAWMTNLTGNYSDASDMVLSSPCFDFSAMAHPKICFDAFFRFEANYDGMILEYTTDDENWNRVEVPGYNSNTSLTVSYGKPWFSGTNSRWRTYCTYMPELAGLSMVRFRFKVGSDPHKTDEGAAIDNFRITELPQYDLAISKLVSPSTACGLGNSEPVSVDILNLGSEKYVTAVVSYTINDGEKVTESFSDTLDYNVPYTYTFDQAADLSTEGGSYSFDLNVAMENDENNSNDSKNNQKVTSTPQSDVPFEEGFESGELPEGWDLSQTGNSKGWVISDAETENAGSSGNLWPIPEHGKFALINDWSVNQNRRNDYLILPPLDLSGVSGAILEYDLFYTLLGSTTAMIKVSTDGGSNWDDIITLNADDVWRRLKTDLSAYVGMSCVYVAFYYDDGGTRATGIAVDNIAVKEKPNYDLKIVNAFLDESTCYSSNEKINLQVENLGSYRMLDFEATYIINDSINPEIKETERLNDPVDPGETITVPSKKTFDLSAPGNYTIKVYITKNTDQTFYNDTLKTFELSNAGIVSSFPYLENFDTLPADDSGILSNGWSNGRSDDIDWWAHKGATSTGYTGPPRDHSGSNKNYMYVESSEPNTNKSADLYSPCFDLNNVSIPYLRFWYNMLSSYPGTGDVMGSLSVDIFDGAWNNDVWTVSGNQGSAWLKAEISLRKFAKNIKVRFRAKTGPAQFSDIAIDDFEIFNKEKLTDIAITSLPLSGCGLEENAEITLGVTNLGTEDIPGGIDLTYKLSNGEPVTGTYNGTLEAGKDLFYTFNKTVPLPKGSHYFDLYVHADGDEDASNDTVTSHRVISFTKIFNYDEVTECEGNWAIVAPSGISRFQSFKWRNDSTAGQTLYTDSAGYYVCTYVFDNGCELTDSVYVNILPAPKTDLKDTTVYDFVTLDPGEFNSYLWQDGSVNRTFYVDSTGMYFVTVSDDNGCYGTDAFEVKILSDVYESVNNSDIALYPNPVQKSMTIEISNFDLNVLTIDIIDINGRTVYTDMVSTENITKHIDVSGLTSGTYLVKVSSDNTVRVRKLIVE